MVKAKTDWWIESKKKNDKKKNDKKKNKSEVVIAGTPQQDMFFMNSWKDSNTKPEYYGISGQYHQGFDDGMNQFQEEYYVKPPAHDQFYDRLRREIRDLNLSLTKSKEEYGIAKSSIFILEQSLGSAELKNKSAEKVANWAVTKLLIESIEKSDEIDRLERKAKEIKVKQKRSNVADRLLGIIDKKDHMIRYLMNEMEKLKKE